MGRFLHHSGRRQRARAYKEKEMRTAHRAIRVNILYTTKNRTFGSNEVLHHGTTCGVKHGPLSGALLLHRLTG